MVRFKNGRYWVCPQSYTNHAIFAEYMAWLVYDCGQTQYLPFLKRTIKTGWANRDKTRNVCGGEYYKKLPEGAEIDSYSAAGIPALMLLFPAKK